MADSSPRREATRRALVEAAIGEFAARGIDATSVEQVCEAAGFTRGAFYSNFQTKDDLCMAILEHHRDMLREGTSRAFAAPPADPSIEWVLGTAIGELFRIIAPTEQFRITLMEIQLRSLRRPELAERWAQMRAHVRPELERLVAEIGTLVGRRFLVAPGQVLNICEALFFQDTSVPKDQSTYRDLIAPITLALSTPVESEERDA